MTGTTNELFHRHGNNGGGRGKRKQHDKQAWDKPGSLHWTSNPPVNVVMSLFLSCRMTGGVTEPFPPPPVFLLPPPPPQPAMRDKQKGTTRAFQIFESTGSAPNRCARYDALDLSLVVRSFLILCIPLKHTAQLTCGLSRPTF